MENLRGGEIMTIGGIGFFNTISSSIKEGTLSTGESGFKNLVSLFLAEGSTSQGTNNPLAEQRSLDIPTEELIGLIDFLGAEDILDVEDGLHLLRQAQSAGSPEELLQIIAETIESNVNVKELIQSFQQNSSMPLEDEISEPNPNQSEPIKLEDLLAMLTQISAFPLDDLNGVAQKDMVQLVKIVKIFELLAPELNMTNDQKQLKDLVQQLTKKLEGFLESANLSQKDDFAKQNSRQEYVLKTFSAVASELNQNNKDPLGKLLGEASTEAKTLSVKTEPVNGIVQFHQISKAEQLTMTLQQQTGKPTGANDLIKQFENILAKSQFSNIGGSQKLLIKLNPEHLGALRIELIQKDAGMVAKILATTKLAKETLESHIQNLKHAFASQNIQVDKLEITQSANQSMERFLNKEHQQQSQQQQQEQHEQNRESKSNADEHTFVSSLEEALINQEV